MATITHGLEAIGRDPGNARATTLLRQLKLSAARVRVLINEALGST